ncbi:HD domain-containing phosphohydrolase [Chitinilyticum piscinae]|uniref:GAF domain-containing protein n=1 Tax=Chitinilyticum piscinae TaxID=2866724 RepID=A0A8J7K369_9NEIS|nr:HD domain-containing phosphohydrolase [Chitinilyticum piscinae]MBE9610987.1 GAF domain-containing protein [Chitinilyticum piscinae]
MNPRAAAGQSIPLYIHISYLFIGLLIGYAAFTGWYQYQATTRLLKDNAQGRFEQIAKMTASNVQSLYIPAKVSVALLANQRLMNATSLEQRLDSLPFLVNAIAEQPASASIYMGYDDGDFFMLRRYLDEPDLKTKFNPPPLTRWIVQSIDHEGDSVRADYLFFDVKLQQIGSQSDPAYRYDPRTRSWFKAASESGSVIITPPYYFFTTQSVGVTLAQRTANQKAVAGIDVNLRSISQLLQQSKATPDSRLILLGTSGNVLGWARGEPAITRQADGSARLKTLAELDAPVLKTMAALPAYSQGQALSFDAEGRGWEGVVTPIALPQGASLTLMIASPRDELLAEAYRIRNNGIFITLGGIAFGLALAIWLARLAARPLDALSAEMQKIERFQFDGPVDVNTRILEVARVARALGSMKETVNRFLQLSSALASETHFDRLLSLILREMQAICHASGGAIYLQESDKRTLALAQAGWLDSVLEQDKPHRIDLETEHLLARALRSGQICQQASGDDLAQTFPELPVPADAGFTLLTLPLRSKEGELLGALVLVVDPQQQELNDDLLAFLTALSGTAATALYTQRLLNEQKILLEAFIQLIAGAIDSKSPYTGGHCQRVPELTKMLARAACDQQQGPFADFSLGDDEWEQLHIAAWLHDCGKVTTPEYVVDKATKLETLYDRIHEVRMRFEVLKRDAEIRCWQGIAAGGDPDALKTELMAELAQLDDDFAFVATCNEGGEFMAADKIERLGQIAARHWQRTLSDRIGISHEEKERKARTPEPPLPVTEALLADKPEHIITRSERDRLPEDNRWGFRVKVPEHLYNRGELYNLAVARGTLSEEERFKINEHIIQTIIMLEKLPFPRHLQRVPEIAGGHHEKMDGSGYPKRLTRDEMSLPARMMAIADIFEALTAIDRPYKKGKTLSEAIKIMSFMKKDQHIDAELFELFLRSGVYRDYAERFMRPEQVDEVDIASILQ